MSVTLTRLAAERRIAPEPTSAQELDELREMSRTALADARLHGLSTQGRFEFAYNAARLLATMVVRAAGYRVTARNGHHYFTFQAMEAADTAFAGSAAYFDDARRKRNDFSYDAPGNVTETEADELVGAVQQFQRDVEAWIQPRYPR
jgi:hypothetical protein